MSFWIPGIKFISMEIANKISEIKTEESAMKDRSGHMSLARGLILSFCSIIWNFIVELELEDRVLVPVVGYAMLFFIPIAGDDEPELYLISDIVGVALDPLLLYIPIINEDTKCLALDNPLKIVVIIFRSLSDLRYILRILRTIKAGLRGGSRKQIAMRLAIEIVAILPIPHVRKRSKPLISGVYIVLVRKIYAWIVGYPVIPHPSC